MDMRESKTPEEELEHLREVKEPEDFAHPEPDADQPEAKSPAGGLPLILPIIIVAVCLLVVAMLLFGDGIM